MPRSDWAYQLGDAGNAKTFIDLGSFIGAIIYFFVFMTTVYLAIVVPYRHIQKRRGVTVFGEAPATKACSECCSDIPEAAHKCKFCASEQSAPGGLTAALQCSVKVTVCTRAAPATALAEAAGSATSTTRSLVAV